MATSNNSISVIYNIDFFSYKYIEFGKYNGKSFK